MNLNDHEYIVGQFMQRVVRTIAVNVYDDGARERIVVVCTRDVPASVATNNRQIDVYECRAGSDDDGYIFVPLDPDDDDYIEFPFNPELAAEPHDVPRYDAPAPYGL